MQIRRGNDTLPPMFCVPLLVKDNFETEGMAASNGASALLDNFAREDAQQVGCFACCLHAALSTGLTEHG